MAEFNPESERHYPLFIVKAVEPGCTTEWQLENLQTGQVVRITTTETAEEDEQNLALAIAKMTEESWNAYITKGSV